MPVYEKINLLRNYKYEEIISQLNDSKLKTKYMKIMNKFNWKKSSKYIEDVSNIILVRVKQVLESYEFSNSLIISPPNTSRFPHRKRDI